MEQRRSGRIWGSWLKISPWDMGEEPCRVTGSLGWGDSGETEARCLLSPKRLAVPVGPSRHPLRSGLLLLLGGVSAVLMPPDTWSWNPAEGREGTGDTGKPGQEVSATSTRHGTRWVFAAAGGLVLELSRETGAETLGFGGKKTI